MKNLYKDDIENINERKQKKKNSNTINKKKESQKNQKLEQRIYLNCGRDVGQLIQR